MVLILFLGLSALLNASAGSPCLDTNSTEYKCQIDASGELGLAGCGITDEDVDSGDLASCLDAAGREEITDLILGDNDLTTLPEGVFQNLTALTALNLENNQLLTLPEEVFQNLTTLTRLSLDYNVLITLPEAIFEDPAGLTTLGLAENTLTTLPAAIFEDLRALTALNLRNNLLTTLPEGIFEDLTTLTTLSLEYNNLTTLPEGIFENLTALTALYLDSNALSTLPQGLFESCTALHTLYLADNNLTTMPKGIFEDLVGLNILKLSGNSLECLPETVLEEVDDDATFSEHGLHVDSYGDECGCSIIDVTTNVCGEETCTPGSLGYTCAPASMAPTPAPSFNLSWTTAPFTTSDGQNSGSESTPIVVGVLSAVAGLILVGLVVRLRRRRAFKQGVHPPGVRPPHDDNNLEGGPDKPRDVPSPSYAAVLAVRNVGDRPPSHLRDASQDHHPQAKSDAVDNRGIVPPSALLLRDGRVPSSAQYSKTAVVDYGAGFAGGHAAHTSAEKLSTATASTATSLAADLSTAERAELAQFHQRQSVAGGSDPTQASSGVGGASPIPHRNRAADELGLGHAVLAAAQELVHHCQTPGISEAATAVCIMARLVTDSRDNDRASEARLRQCRSVVMGLKRAASVTDKGGDTMGETARVLIEEVHEAIVDLVDLIRTFQSKNKLSKAFMSTLFKRRQDELDAVVDRAILRLQLSLQLQVGHDVSAVKDGVDLVQDDMKAVKDGVSAVKDHVSAVKDDVNAVKDDVSSVKEAIQLYKGTYAEAKSGSVAEVRSVRRQRKLDQVEIPEDHVFITSDLLGKGGFGEVYLADYNGHNAAAKVLNFAHGLGALEENLKQQETSQRRAFLRELEAMIRLRSPNTVNVYGAVTSLPDRMVLVMELLVGGDLLTLLRKSVDPLPEEQCRRIIGDICTGMAFLHSKNTVHGDLKSANVLLDGDGRAKIADFGTSKWSHHTNSTGLATYTTNSSQSAQMSIAWSAPEVLDSGGSTYKSDVYSFGIVVWEVFSRERPWAKKTRPSEILTAVLRGGRPVFGVDAPADIMDIAKACWSGEPNERSTFRDILEGMRGHEGQE